MITVDWARIVIGALSLLVSFVAYLRERQKISTTDELRVAAAMRARSDEIAKATAARARVDVVLSTGGVSARDLQDKWTRD